MKRILFFIVLTIGMITANAQNPHFAGGSGTPSDPWQITEPQHLDNLRHYLYTNGIGKHFKLMNDIDLTDYIENTYPEKGWLPIGKYGYLRTGSIPFTSKMDGNCKKVTGLWIVDTSNRQAIGLFAAIGNGGEIRNLGIEVAENKIIKEGSSFPIGILVGYNGGLIEKCNTKGNIIGKGNDIGGLVGYNGPAGTIINCYHHGNISIDSTYPVSNAGGFCGRNLGTISNCYSTGNINSCSGCFIGGFVGDNVLIDHFTGEVDASGIISGCYYDAESNPSLPGIGRVDNNANNNAIGKSLSQLKQKSTFTGWDFDNLWHIEDGHTYPTFECTLVDIGCSYKGSGTQSDPYLISTPKDLDCIREHIDEVGAYFLITNDIDLTDYIDEVYGELGWLPIGQLSNGQWNNGQWGNGIFRGNLMGCFHTISGLWMNRQDENTDYYTGLFGIIQDASIERLIIKGHPEYPIIGNLSVGALAGSVYNSRISMCSFIGINALTNPPSSSVMGQAIAGGLIGYADMSSIDFCSARGVIDGRGYVGGLVGDSDRSKFHNCYSQGFTYHDGQINNPVGGMIGRIYNNFGDGSECENCYAACRNISWVSDFNGRLIGGFAGFHGGSNPSSNVPAEIRNIYYNNEFSGYRNGSEKVETVGTASPFPVTGAGLSTAQMKSKNSYPSFNFTLSMSSTPQLMMYNGFKFPCDFTYTTPSIWGIVEGSTFPFFLHEIKHAEDIIAFQDLLDRSSTIDNLPGNNPDWIRVYPNPTTGIVYVDVDGNPEILVTDRDGNYILNTYVKQINLSNYPAGIYLFHVGGGVKKVIKL